MPQNFLQFVKDNVLWQKHEIRVIHFLVLLLIMLGSGACAADVSDQIVVPETTKPPAFRVGVLFEAQAGEGNMLEQTVWRGLMQAQQGLGAAITVRETAQKHEIPEQLAEMAADGQDVILVLGADGASALKTVAPRFPAQPFLLIDAPLAQPNVSSLTFDLAPAAFLSGYLAAGVSSSGVVCTFANIKNEEATAIMRGFSAGVNHFNRQKGADVIVAGWDDARGEGAFTGGYAAEQQVPLAQSLLDAGCDVMLPVIGEGVTEVAALVAQQGAALIGMPGDGFLFAPDQAAMWLTSLQKNVDSVLFETLQTLAGGGRVGDFRGTLDNGGVALSPLHDWENRLPESLKTELSQLHDDLIDGNLEPR